MQSNLTKWIQLKVDNPLYRSYVGGVVAYGSLSERNSLYQTSLIDTRLFTVYIRPCTFRSTRSTSVITFHFSTR